MEKKDYLSFAGRYALLKNREELYRKELEGFIDDAFKMHGNEFVLKPDDGFETWEEADESDEGLDVCSRFDMYFEVEDKYGHVHMIYPTRIYRTKADYRVEYVDGYDYEECKFVEGWVFVRELDALETVAWFINAVLEQEQKINL